MQMKDKRLKLTNEVISGIRASLYFSIRLKTLCEVFLKKGATDIRYCFLLGIELFYLMV